MAFIAVEIVGADKLDMLWFIYLAIALLCRRWGTRLDAEKLDPHWSGVVGRPVPAVAGNHAKSK